MNVFVLSTGRCGSTTFTAACSHIENYTSAHESRIGRSVLRTEYPNSHIEVDNRLSWFLGRLEERYGDDAFYVHLKRDLDATARSYAKRYDEAIINAYRKRIIWRAEGSPVDVCRHYCKTVNSNIELFLKGKTKQMNFRLETAKEDFQDFWNRIEATGDLSKALSEWDRKHNASDQTDQPDQSYRPGHTPTPLPVRLLKKAQRVARKLPIFLRNA